MEFDPKKVEEFLQLFHASKEKIRASEGCLHLELLNDINQSNVFFTYSYWESPAYLEMYRKSDLFEQVWSKTKVLFAAKPQAWSVEQSWVSPKKIGRV